METKCIIENCEGWRVTKGFCAKHYTRFWKYGDPLYTKTSQHGMRHTPEYRIWAGMKQRCYNKNCNTYHYYGGRGIKVCAKWKNDFMAFYTDMGLIPFPKAQIDRKNNEDDYSLENCHWVTAKENTRNKPSNKLNMIKAKEIRKKCEIDGMKQNIIAGEYGVSGATISSIMNNKSWRD